MGYVSMQRLRTFRYVVYDQVHDYVRNGWVVSATFPPSVHHSQYSLIMEKGMAVLHDSPLYPLACALNDIEHTLTKHFTLNHGTFGGDISTSITEARTQLATINDALIDVMPHLEEIRTSYYADEQRHFEEMKEAEGTKPDQHIFYSLDQLDDFIKAVEDMKDV